MNLHIVLLPGLLNNANLFAEQIPALSTLATVEVGDLTTGTTISEMAAGIIEKASAKQFVLLPVTGRLRCLRNHAPGT